MRAWILAAVFLGACGTSEPIKKTASPIGCWVSSDETLALRRDGSLSHAAPGGTTLGTWQLQDRALVLFDGGALQRWDIVDLTARDMWTDGGAVKHWQSIPCSP